MIQVALQDFRHELHIRHLHINSIEQMVDRLEGYLYERVAEITTEKLFSALEYAQLIGADEFIETAEIVDFGEYFEIRTTSGKTNFSTPRREMLPGILSQAKINRATGERYQRIGIKKKMKSSFDSDAALQGAMEKAKEANRAVKGQSTTTVATQALESFRAQYAANKAQPRSVISTDWATATSKQDAGSKWVIQEKEKDMTQFLNSLNSDLNDSIRIYIKEQTSGFLEELEERMG